MNDRLVAGIFVGGRSRRMGGAPKGLLEAPDGRTIVARTVALVRRVAAEVVLVGTNDAYAALALPMLADAQPNAGPLGALVALLEHARDRTAIAIACDMPHLTPGLVSRLASEAAGAAIVAPRERHAGGKWSPLFARYDAPQVRAHARAQLGLGALSLQSLFDLAVARELVLDADERRALTDWDRPEDIDRS